MGAPNHIAQELLAKAHPPETAASLFIDKVLHKPLHLKPSSEDPTSKDARARRRLLRLRNEEKIKRRRKVKPLSAKEKRITGIYDLSPESRKYSIYQPLHAMWLDYMTEILGVDSTKPGFVSAATKGSTLASADYHGAQVEVVRARCAGLVGLQGIVVKDTKFTLQVITQKDELKGRSIKSIQYRPYKKQSSPRTTQYFASRYLKVIALAPSQRRATRFKVKTGRRP